MTKRNWTTYEMIERLLSSKITSYHLGKYIGRNAQYIDNFRKGRSQLKNMQLEKASKLVEFIHEKNLLDLWESEDNGN